MQLKVSACALLLMACLLLMGAQGTWMRVAPAVAAGVSVSVNLGGLTQLNTDNGNALLPFVTPFTTPAGISSASFASCSAWWGAPDATNKNWGCAIYTDNSGNGTINTQNAGTGGCSANCATLVSGSNFSTGWPNTAIYISGTRFVVSSVQSSTVLTLTTAPGTQTGVTYADAVPGTLVCSAFSSTVVTSGYNTPLTLSSCPATASTMYWVAEITVSNTQTEGTTSTFGTCPYAHIGSINKELMSTTGDALASFNSNADWPSTFPFSATHIGDGIGNASNGNGCYTIYANLNYATTDLFSVYNLYEYWQIGATQSAQTFSFPAFAANHTIIVAAMSKTNSINAAPTVVDNLSNTITQRGSCSINVSAGGLCWFSANAATGITSVTITYNAGTHINAFVIDAGRTAGGTLTYDTSEYDGALTPTPFTSGTLTTTQNPELLFGVLLNFGLNNGYETNCPLYLPSGSWAMDANTQDGFASPNAEGQALFQQEVTAITTYTLTGSFNCVAGNGTQNLLAQIGFK